MIFSSTSFNFSFVTMHSLHLRQVKGKSGGLPEVITNTANPKTYAKREEAILQAARWSGRASSRPSSTMITVPSHARPTKSGTHWSAISLSLPSPLRCQLSTPYCSITPPPLQDSRRSRHKYSSDVTWDVDLFRVAMV